MGDFSPKGTPGGHPKVKVSFYSTVLNEQGSIDAFLASLYSQTRIPDEIVIVDGGSHDRTKEIVASHMAAGAPVKLVQLPGANVAEGRNAGFAAARYDLVASSDAGCRLHPQWLERLIDQVKDDIDIVSGVFLPDPKSLFEACVGDLMYDDVSALPDDWPMPSHRSVLIRKRVWEAIGGFPKQLYRSEDTWFNLEAKRRGFRFRLARQAIVYWRPRSTLADLFRNGYLWTRSDVENKVNSEAAGRSAAKSLLRLLWRASAILLIVALLSTVPLPISLLPLPFLARSAIKIYPREWSLPRTLTKNVIENTNDLAGVLGWFSGSWRRFWRPAASRPR